MFASLRCFLRKHHNPMRHPLGGFKCADCGAVAEDLEEMGLGHGYVSPIRRLFSGRARNDRVNRWEPPRYR